MPAVTCSRGCWHPIDQILSSSVTGNLLVVASAAGAVAHYKRVIDFAEILGTVPVTLQGLSLWTKNCDNRNDAKDQLLTCCEAVNRYAHERGVRTLYEVCNHYEVPLIHTAQECRELIEAVGEGNMGMILDSFHMNINEQDPLQAIRANLDLLEIYHISDSGRGGIGTGHINFRTHHRTLLEGGFAGHVAIEPVLAHLTPSNSPRSADDQAQLDAQIYHSASCWRSYSNDLPE